MFLPTQKKNFVLHVYIYLFLFFPMLKSEVWPPVVLVIQLPDLTPCTPLKMLPAANRALPHSSDLLAMEVILQRLSLL